MSGKIFINYRRGDDPGYTQALYQRLEEEFSPTSLFMDVEGHIKPGDDFVDVLGAQVALSDVLLAVIGPRWNDLLLQRLEDPDDFVVIEIKAALDSGKRVIPVLVGGATMPRTDALPPAIRSLARRNAAGLRPERFKADCQGLVAALRDQLAAAEHEREARTASDREAAEDTRRQQEAEEAARLAAAEERARAQAIAGLSPEEIRKAEELANWDFIKDRSDSKIFRDHLARFPDGVTTLYATTRLEQLTWSALGDLPDIASLTAYLEEFPRGANAEPARLRLEQLREQADRERALAERTAKETAEWGAVAASTDRAEIEAFIASWPDGMHAAAARARLVELKTVDDLSKGGISRRGLITAFSAGSVASLAAGALHVATRKPEAQSNAFISKPTVVDQAIKTLQTGSEELRAIRFTQDSRYVTFLRGDDPWYWEISSNRASAGVVAIPVSADLAVTAKIGVAGSMMLSSAGSSRSAVASPDGNRLFVPVEGGVKVLDVPGDRELRTLTAPDTTILLPTADGRWLITGSYYAEALQGWEVSSGRRLRTFKLRNGSGSVVHISPDSRYLLVASQSGSSSMQIWDLNLGRELPGIRDGLGDSDVFAIAPDSRHVATRGPDNKSIRIWDIATGKQVSHSTGHASYVYALGITRDSRRVLSADADALVRISQLATGALQHELSGHTSHVKGLAVAPDGQHVATASIDTTIKLWKLPE